VVPAGCDRRPDRVELARERLVDVRHLVRLHTNQP
jgi:hypothetical protein